MMPASRASFLPSLFLPTEGQTTKGHIGHAKLQTQKILTIKKISLLSLVCLCLLSCLLLCVSLSCSALFIRRPTNWLRHVNEKKKRFRTLSFTFTHLKNSPSLRPSPVVCVSEILIASLFFRERINRPLVKKTINNKKAALDHTMEAALCGICPTSHRHTYAYTYSYIHRGLQERTTASGSTRWPRYKSITKSLILVGIAIFFSRENV